MNASTCFAPDYATSRAGFLDKAVRLGGALLSFPHQAKGPAGEALATDMAWFGPSDAAHVLVMVSATHGVEGFCGAGAMLDWLDTAGPERLAPQTAALLIHGLNPHGFAWLRRVNEDGIDLNRNGLDFKEPLPDNPGYRVLADAFVPRAVDPEKV